MACFGDINVSQGSAATYARCGGTFNTHLTANLPRYLPVIFLNKSRFDRIMVTSLQVDPFFGHPVYRVCASDSALTKLVGLKPRVNKRASYG